MSNDGIRAFSWNARNQLASIGTTTFQYDALGRRSQNGAGVGLVVLQLSIGVRWAHKS
jgi:hypothetical protein